jgi:hypothetical protein
MHRSGRSAAVNFRNHFGGHSVMVAVRPFASNSCLPAEKPEGKNPMPHNQPFLTFTEALLYSLLLGLMTWVVRFATNQARMRRLIASESDSIVLEDLRKDSLRISTIVWCFAPPISLWFGYLYVAHFVPSRTSQWWIAMSIPPAIFGIINCVAFMVRERHYKSVADSVAG